MASDIQFLNNFPVKFQNEPDSCLECDGRDFCQLAEWGDRFEFAYDPGRIDVAVNNPNFTTNLSGWTVGAGWTWVAGAAKATTPSGTLSQSINVIAGRKYKVTFTALPVTSGAVIGVDIGNAGTSFNLSDGIATYSAYIVANNTAGIVFTVSASYTLYIDTVTVELVAEDCGIELYNTETGTYSNIRKYANLINAQIGTLGYSYLWSDMGLLYDGCYKIAVFGSTDGNTLVTNGNFTTNLSGWTVDPEWTWIAGKAHLDNSGGNDGILSQNLGVLIVTGQRYRLTFTLSNMTGGMSVNIGATILYPAGILSNGTYTIDFTAPAGHALEFYQYDNDTIVDLDSVSIGLLACTLSELSECYKLTTEHECTKMLSWTNESTNGFNYPYFYFYNGSNHGFQWMRVESDLRNAKYPGQAEKYIDSGGNNILYYGSVRKLKDFIVAMMPEYMHDALAVGFKHKAFYIDGVRYTLEDTDYTPEWSTEIPTILAESTSLVGKYNQDNYSID